MSRLLILLLVGVSLVSAQQEHGGAPAGEQHEAAEHAEPSIYWKWANFLLFAGAIGFLLSKKAGPYFRSRTEQVQGALHEAARLQKEAEVRAAEIERRVANLAAESQQMRDAAKQEMSAEAERIRRDTDRILARIEAQAEQEIASAAKLAKEELRAFSAELAVNLAAEQIRERLSADVQEGLVRQFVTGLDATSASLRQ